MDNRRLSARAETGAAAPYFRPSAGPAAQWLDRAIDLTQANWEVLLYVGLMAIAVLTRVWDLGPRALHHDESIHAYYSSLYLKGGGYNYDPTYHGPFLYNIVALGFFLFGTTDATARIMPAFFGIALIGMCWFLRPFIGRVSAIIAVLLVTLSPSISYYSRSLRHDIFALTGSMALFISILWFLRTHDAKWVFFGAIGFSVAFTSHELTYIIAFIFAVYLAIAYFAYPFFARRSEFNSRRRALGDDINPVSSALASLNKQRWTIGGAALIFLAIYSLLFTNLLTKPQELSGPNKGQFTIIEGFTESLSYWLGQHAVERGGQPRFYYLMTMGIYEILASVAGILTVGYMIIKGFTGAGDSVAPVEETDAKVSSETDQYGVVLPSISGLRGFTLGFLAFWSFGALIAFSLAGERMPWLTMQSALPFSLLAAAGLGRLITKLEWRQIWKGGGAFVGVAVVLFLFSAFNLMHHLNGSMPAATGAGAGLQNGIRLVLLLVFTFGFLALAAWLAYKIMPGRAVGVVAVTFAVLLGLYGLRSMMELDYRHGDVPVEMMVYTQSAPDVPRVADLIKRLSRDETAFDAGRTAADVTGGRSLQISIDQSVEWPFDWYFRDMRSLNYFNTTQWTQKQQNVVPASVPVILASDETEADAGFQAYIKDKYTTQKYVLRWWFPEELYKTNNVGDLGKAWSWITGPSFVRYLLYRDTGLPLGSTNFNLHIRNDLAVKTGLGAAAGTAAQAPDTTVDPSVKINLFQGGQAGNANGQLNKPRGIALDANGNFYVVDTANFRVQKYDSKGDYLAKFGSKGNSDGQFAPISDSSSDTGASGIAVDKAGNIYVADVWNHRIEKFDKDGKFLAKWGSFISLADAAAADDGGRDSKMYGPRGVAVGPDGNVYVTDTGNKRVLIFDANGGFIRKIDSGMTAQKKSPEYPFNKPGEMNEPIGIAVDASGNVYVADSVNKRIQKFDNTGKFITMWNIPGTGWDSGQYMEPFLAVDGAGNVYASGPTGAAVYKFNSTGQLQGQKSKNGASTVRIPTGIAVAPNGTIYVVDTGSNTAINLGTIP